MNPGRKTFQSMVRHRDLIVDHHRVHGLRIMPGVTFLDVIYRAAIAAGFPPDQIELRNILFPEPLALTEEFDRKVELCLRPAQRSWDVVVRSMKTRDDCPLEATWTTHARCELHLPADRSDERIEVAALKAGALEQTDLENLYVQLQRLDIRHQEFMKPSGRVFRGETFVLAELALSDLSMPYASDFHLHPALLDCATGLSFFAGGDGQHDRPYIPIHIACFRAVRALGERCLVFIPAGREKPRSEGEVAQDRQIRIYSPTGEFVACFERLTFKKVREPELILKQGELKQPPLSGAASGSVELARKEENIRAHAEAVPRTAQNGSLANIRAELKRRVAGALNLSPGQIDERAGFYELGLESTQLLRLVGELEEQMGRNLYPTLFFEYPTISELSAYLLEHYPENVAQLFSAPGRSNLSGAPNEHPIDSEAPAPEGEYDFQVRWVEAGRLAEAASLDAEVWMDGDPLPAGQRRAILIFDQTNQTMERVRRDLQERGVTQVELVRVSLGPAFSARDDGGYQINPDEPEDYRALLKAVSDRALYPAEVLSFWSYGTREDDLSAESVDQALRPGLSSVFRLSQAWLESRNKQELRLFVFYDSSAGARPAIASIAGFAACVRRETPHVEVRLVGVNEKMAEHAPIAAMVTRELAAGGDAPEVRYSQERRYIRRAVPLRSDSGGLPHDSASQSPGLRTGGVYLITGGAGGLGLIFAEHLAREYQARIVLIGRSELGPEQACRISSLEKLGGRAIYLRADVTDKPAVASAIGLAKAQFGQLHGVIHAAGVLKDGLVVSANGGDLEAVLAPKVKGTLILDDVTQDEPLDFFALFSSLSGFIGSVGQSLYAGANRFLDEFADWREEKRRVGQRSGKTLSLAWPLWAGGGMQGDDRLRGWLRNEFGIRPLEPEAGVRAFGRALASGPAQFVVASGDYERICKGLKVVAEPAATPGGLDLAGESRGTPAPANRHTAIPRSGFRPEDIAIIGVSGRYPMARDLEEFWANLAAGRDCITEIPAERWDHRPYYDPAGSTPSQTKSKWGGFISDHDKFEPLLFNISPREAELIDPQERLLLEVVWACLEDAGYTRKQLQFARPGRAKNDVGVFVGVMWGDYRLLGEEGRLEGGPRIGSAYHWSIANRVSFCFNFNGPSLAVDSACSSSLAAIHLACDSLRRGDCRAALAGGVNLSLHPSKYLLLAQSNMLSSDGRCRSFGEGGDGYVPGEGIGAILLKPVAAALEDGDHIHAIIKGSALNHDGHANGYTVPNPQAQTRVIEEALERAGVNPRSISYLEAHGTGTSLGDPVEIVGLTNAFGRRTADRQFCALGSVKSAIGHLESAAGIAAMTKVLLQLKHGKLAPSLHTARLNPNIDFPNSPFRVQRALGEWPRPVLEVDGRREEQPRRAGVSSFGAGGTNVHLVLEELMPGEKPAPGTVPMVLTLSAQNEERLRAVARRLRDDLERTDCGLTDWLYTLQVGRESLDGRLAICAGDREGFLAGLDSYLAGAPIQRGYAGRIRKRHASPPLSDSETRQLARLPPPVGENWQTLDEDFIARLWVNGHDVDWGSLAQGSLQRVPLPTYPFAGKRYWISGGKAENNGRAVPDLSPLSTEGLSQISRNKSPNDDRRSRLPVPISLWRPLWVARPLIRRGEAAPGSTLLLFDEQTELHSHLLTLPGMERCILVKAGRTFGQLDPRVFEIDPANPEHYARLLGQLFGEEQRPRIVVWRWTDEAWSMRRLETGQPPHSMPGLDRLFYFSRAFVSSRRKGPTRFIYLCEERSGPNPLDEAAASFLKCAHLEAPDLRPQIVRCESSSTPALGDLLAAELAADPADFDIRYQGLQRGVKELRPFELESPGMLSELAPRLKPEGVYLITGGAGGIGLALARHLAKRVQARLILLGRTEIPRTGSWERLRNDSTLSSGVRTKVAHFAEIEKEGGRVLYLRADVSQMESIQAALAEARLHFGRLDGVVHGAGLTLDGSLAKKEKSAFDAVLAAKITGTALLDQLTRGDRLDFFCLFSSISAVWGNPGQSDYAAGNGFMDAFARVREHWRARGLRHGKTLSINWPIWEEGGLRGDDFLNRSLFKHGLELLRTPEAMTLFEGALGLLLPQVIVLAGDGPAIAAALDARRQGRSAPEESRTAANGQPGATNPGSVEQVIAYLTGLVAGLLKLEDAGVLDPEAEVTEYGMDSIVLKELVQRINADCGDLLDPFVALQKKSIRALAEHLASLDAALPPRVAARSNAAAVVSPPPSSERADARGRTSPQAAGVPGAAADQGGNRMEEIAVIGMAGRFPQAESLDEFWQNLVSGRRCIREIPPGRWSIPEHFAQGGPIRAKSYSKWGGFIDGIDLFDPEFFGLSGKAAAVIDPLHRLLLEISARAFENAGYSRESLRRQAGGVFVGARQGEYAAAAGLDRLMEADAANAWRYNSACMIARRIAEAFDLKGPAYVVDTACSSSLVSVHMACESLRHGECDIAIAGGVELLLGPDIFIHFSQSGSLSADGVCRPFESRANGTVLGEGGGAVVLKKLDRALADGDNVLAIIKGSAMSNEGAATDAESQVESMKSLMRAVYQKSGITPGEVGYFELHGEGSLLRDAVELRAIKEIGDETGPAAPGRCPVGSVKANIGHLLLASGIAGFIKACLMLSRKGMPPHVPDSVLARYAGFVGGPYEFNRQFREWNPPPGAARVIGINATGIAGTNCFVLCADSPHPCLKPVLSPRPMNKRPFWIGKSPEAPVSRVDEVVMPPSGAASPNPSAAARNGEESMAGQIDQICAAILKRNGVDRDTNFFELGMDSFKILQLFRRVDEVFGVALDPTRLAEFSTIRGLVAHLLAARGKTETSRPEATSVEPAAPLLPLSCESHRDCEIDFGLYFFADYDRSAGNAKYRLLLDAVKFADENGFSSVFTPERHFAAFGGIFPNPSVTSAALAAITKQIHLRAGSVVSPLHDPVRIAEEWSVVDNLSNGRAAISFTYGWQCDDFVLRPDAYLDRHAEMFRQIETVKRLWRGEAIRRVNGLGKEIEIRIYPEPIQKELPVWVTCAISRDSFVNAGKIGANIVTFLLGQGINDLKQKIGLYRESLQANGFDPAQGRVSLMVHTFIGDHLEQIKKTIRQPFLKFIRSQAQLARNLVQSLDPAQDIDDPKSLDELMDIGFERFFGNSGLLGTLATCGEAVQKFKAIGVDELSCLIDFGLDYEAVMGGLRELAKLKAGFPPSRKPRAMTPEMARSLGAGGGGGHRARPAAPAPEPPQARQEPAQPRVTACSHGANDAGKPSIFDRLDRFRSFLPGGANVPGGSDHPLVTGGNGAGGSNGSDSSHGAAAPKHQAGASGPAAVTQNGGPVVEAETAAGPPRSSASGIYQQINPDRRSAHEPFGLTAVQQAYWMGRNPRFELGATSTHGYAEWVVSLDLERFQQAVQRVVDRHPMLRAVVLSGREQRVLPGNPRYQMKVVDLRFLPAKEREEALEAERRSQSHRIFRPDEWPLFDFHAFKLTDHDQHLTFGFDSLIADAASLAVIFREIMHYYHHPEKSLPELHLTFRDYLLAYHQFRSSETYQQDKDYWLNQIDSFPPPPALPLKKAPAEVIQQVFRRQTGVIQDVVWQRLKAAARQNMVTPTVLLFTAFARVLSEWSGQPQFTLNLTVFNRLPFHEQVGQIVGDFTSLMLVKIEARPGDFWEQARRTQAEVFAALQHRHFDGVDVIKELGKRRNLLGKAILPIVFTSNLLNSENGGDALSELGKVTYVISQTTQAYLDNQVAETAEGLSIAWDYVEELFEPETIQEMFGRYVALLERLDLAPPAVDASRPTLSAFVERYNSTDDPTLKPATLPELFQRQAELTPDLEAVRFEGESLTYRELDGRSNQVARFLQFQGIGAHHLVGVLAPRRISTIINTLAILKAGAAYVPIEPDYPPARRQFIMEKSRCQTVLDDSTWLQAQARFPASALPSRATPDDLAYVIFTSGSTGRPKGVMIAHRAAANTILDLNRRYQLGPGDRVLGISSLCFDLSVYDIFGSLAAGATLVLIKDIQDPKWMARVVREEKITVWNSVPTLLRLLIEHAPPEYSAEAVRLVLLSGDWIPLSLPGKARGIFPRSAVTSLGGATEASIWSIFFPITEVDPAWRSIPYGYPLKNQKWYVLDETMRICPVGRRGELYIAGAGLSQGYLHEPDKTAAAFITHPELGPLYRTGDWGVWREPGYIEFLGRQDQQIKIRGFRVELGEIESQLRQHPAIEDAVVLPSVDENGDKSLCAYLVPKSTRS